MATIVKRSGQWQVRVRTHGQYATRTFSHVKDARTWAADTERGFEAGASSGAGLRTFVRDVVKDYIEDLAKSDAKDKAEPKRLAQWWNKKIGSMRLGDVSPAVIAKHLKPMRHGRSAQTYNHHLSAASRLFRCAAEQHLIGESPTRLVKRRKVSNDEAGRALTIEESRAIFAACDASTDKTAALAIRMALETGARKGELLRLKVVDVDLTRGQATLRDTKNGDDRKVALPAYLVLRLREHMRVRPIDDDRVLRVTKMQLDHAWRMIRAAAGLSWRPRFHDLRHSAVTRFAKTGATLEELKAASGHRSAAMVLRYLHSDEPPAALIERAAIGD
jgi:integrase